MLLLANMVYEYKNVNRKTYSEYLKVLNDSIIREKNSQVKLKLSSTTHHSMWMLMNQLTGRGNRGFRA
jgi:hypothetical protein